MNEARFQTLRGLSTPPPLDAWPRAPFKRTPKRLTFGDWNSVGDNGSDGIPRRL